MVIDFAFFVMIVVFGLVIYLGYYLVKKFTNRNVVSPANVGKNHSVGYEVKPLEEYPTGLQRVFMTNKGYRMYTVDVHGMPINSNATYAQVKCGPPTENF